MSLSTRWDCWPGLAGPILVHELDASVSPEPLDVTLGWTQPCAPYP